MGYKVQLCELDYPDDHILELREYRPRCVPHRMKLETKHNLNIVNNKIKRFLTCIFEILSNQNLIEAINTITYAWFGCYNIFLDLSWYT